MFDFALGAIQAADLVKNIQAFIGPLLLLGVGIVAIKHLVSRQMTQFFQFMAVAVLILLLFYTPGVLLAVVNVITSFFGGGAPSVTNVSSGTSVIPG